MRSQQVADLAGISYRRLDYLTRTVPHLQTNRTLTAGSGSRRLWTPDQLARITVAALLAEAGGGDLPTMARVVFDLPTPPPPAGWAWVCPDPVTAGYSADIRDLVEQLEETGAGVVMSYNLRDLYGDQADVLDDLVAA